MKPKTLVFEPWHSAKNIKGWQKLYKGRDMPVSMQRSIDNTCAKINGVRAYELRKEGIRKIWYHVFSFDNISLIYDPESYRNENKSKLGKFESREEATKFAQNHYNNFVKSLLV